LQATHFVLGLGLRRLKGAGEDGHLWAGKQWAGRLLTCRCWRVPSSCSCLHVRGSDQAVLRGHLRPSPGHLATWPPGHLLLHQPRPP
jgi:hypothetical protein